MFDYYCLNKFFMTVFKIIKPKVTAPILFSVCVHNKAGGWGQSFAGILPYLSYPMEHRVRNRCNQQGRPFFLASKSLHSRITIPTNLTTSLPTNIEKTFTWIQLNIDNFADSSYSTLFYALKLLIF